MPSDHQIASLKEALQEDYAKYGPGPVLGHGQVQSDKMATEPDGLPWSLVGLGTYQPGVGRFLIEEPQVQNPVTDAQIKGWLETYGVGVNMDTGIMQFVAASFRNGSPPCGNWRGPARWAPDGNGGELVGVGEYTVNIQMPDGRVEQRIRHRFSAGICEFNPITGGLGWMELVNDPAQIDYNQ
jgi:hypothetical protein